MKKESLLGVQLDDEVFLDGHIDVLAGGHGDNSTLQGVLVTLQPLGDGDQRGVLAGQALEGHGGAAALADLDDIANANQIGGDVHLLAIDGEMQVNFAMNRELRDAKYPFTRLKGKDVNTLIFPNLSSANSAYKLLQAMDTDAELIGPIQMGLNKPIHFTDFESSVRDIVNITAVAVIDSIVDKKKAAK